MRSESVMGNNCIGNITSEDSNETIYKALIEIEKNEIRVEKLILYLLKYSGEENPDFKKVNIQIEKLDKQLETYRKIRSALTNKLDQKKVNSITIETKNILKEISYSSQFDFSESALHNPIHELCSKELCSKEVNNNELDEIKFPACPTKLPKKNPELKKQQLTSV